MKAFDPPNQDRKDGKNEVKKRFYPSNGETQPLSHGLDKKIEPKK
jgi:hypothetical protein